MNLPEMTVELRDSETAHGIPAPNLEESHIEEQLKEAVQFNQDAKEDGWKETTIELLKKYIPFEVEDGEIETAIKDVMGFDSWKDLSKWVVDDMCSEFFNMALKFCLRDGQSHKRSKGFIDGSGIGYLKEYNKRLKVTLEECFDAKYKYKVLRPLEVAKHLIAIANAIHPGHWAYPAGHGTKFLTAIEVLNDVFNLDRGCYRKIFIAACVAAMSRSGNLIHYPQDNLAGGYLTTLKEFN